VIAFLGTGRMGSPMAANLARGGFGVRVWNRTIGRAEALTTDGAVVASSPAEAVQGATIVITMLADGPATEQAATGPDGLLAASPGSQWACGAALRSYASRRMVSSMSRFRPGA
jgi:3-hydroxyisobutyrate dehydrogenase